MLQDEAVIEGGEGSGLSFHATIMSRVFEVCAPGSRSPALLIAKILCKSILKCTAVQF